MVKVSVFYPNTPGCAFDMQYYVNQHMPMVQQKLGPALKGVFVDHGLGGGVPGSDPPYVAMCHLMFDSVEAFQQAWAPHAAAIVGDIPNYTSVEPIIQVSEVKLQPAAVV
jgi:uncharacterized protein (TIGR02118 family)